MSFKKFDFNPKIQAGIDACGYTRPTPIQDAAIPPVLEGRDVLGLAQTGTGKTAAFVLPLLQRLLKGPQKQCRVLILAPTRELASQIHDNIEALAQKTSLKSVAVYGGVGKRPQITKIRNGAEFIVACPGRLLDLLNEKALSLDTIEVLVLDEADQMFDKGFLPDIKRIIAKLPAQRQAMVFSATMPKEIRKLTRQILKNPVTAQIANTQSVKEISHSMIQVRQENKTALLKSLIQDPEMISTIVFTRTKHKARKLARQLTNAGFNSTCLQGNLSQQKRQKALDGFKDGTFSILVATDIAARGIDVSGISHVVNYDVPDTAEAYIHRTGRTGRASRTGKALSFVTDKDSKIIRLIERNMGQKLQKTDAPDFPSTSPAPRIPEGDAPKESPAREETEERTQEKKARPSRRRRPRRPARRRGRANTASQAKEPTKKQAKAKSPQGASTKATAKKQAGKAAPPKPKSKAGEVKNQGKKSQPSRKKTTGKAAAPAKADAGPAKSGAEKGKKTQNPKGQKAKPKGRARDACPMPLAILGHKPK
ncbi:MAG: DEAD/DEAH box helicase [Desulfobacterales bacterium]|nr:DEAD/DEAH box helicase [Desulfobacterales bacterium]